MHPLVSEFLDGAPGEHRPRLEALHALIEAALPNATIVAPNAFPVWTVDDQWVAGLGAPKKGPMLYIMVHSVLEEFESELGTLRSGRSCVEMRSRRGWTDEQLMDVAARLIARAASVVQAS